MKLHQEISPFIKREIYTKAVEYLDAAKDALISIGYVKGDCLLDETEIARKSAIFAQSINEQNCKRA